MSKTQVDLMLYLHETSVPTIGVEGVVGVLAMD